MKTLVIGLGNPILGDDGVGWVVAQKVQEKLKDSGYEVEVDCLALGGLNLMERMIGFERVILIDSLNTGQRSPGSLVTFTLDELEDLTHGHSSAAHDATIKTALATGRRLQVVLPQDKDVHVVAIEARHVYELQEELSPLIAAVVPLAIGKVMELLDGFDH